jgi:hypothetical protein
LFVNFITSNLRQLKTNIKEVLLGREKWANGARLPRLDNPNVCRLNPERIRGGTQLFWRLVHRLVGEIERTPVYGEHFFGAEIEKSLGALGRVNV